MSTTGPEKDEEGPDEGPTAEEASEAEDGQDETTDELKPERALSMVIDENEDASPSRAIDTAFYDSLRAGIMVRWRVRFWPMWLIAEGAWNTMIYIKFGTFVPLTAGLIAAEGVSRVASWSATVVNPVDAAKQAKGWRALAQWRVRWLVWRRRRLLESLAKKNGFAEVVTDISRMARDAPLLVATYHRLVERIKTNANVLLEYNGSVPDELEDYVASVRDGLHEDEAERDRIGTAVDSIMLLLIIMEQKLDLSPTAGGGSRQLQQDVRSAIKLATERSDQILQGRKEAEDAAEHGAASPPA